MELDALPRHVGRGAFDLPSDEQHRPCVASHRTSLASARPIAPEQWLACGKSANRAENRPAQGKRAVTTLDKKQRSTARTSKPASVMPSARSLAM